MPTDAWRRSAGGLPLAAVPILGSDYSVPNPQIISTVSSCSSGGVLNRIGLATYASNTYPAASRALAIPFWIAYPFLVRKVFWFNGATASTDSADVGVYTEAGARLVSGGGTTISGANATQEVDVTDTLLQPGRYWMAYSQNGVTATPIMSNAGSAGNVRAAGCAQMASAYVLPSTFTPAAIASPLIPLIGIASRTLAS